MSTFEAAKTGPALTHNGANHDVALLLKLGQVYLASGKRTLAEKAFRRCSEVDPTDFRGFYNLGVTLSQGPSSALVLSQALAYFGTAQRLKPELVDTYGSMAAIHIRLRQFTEAYDICRAGLEIDGNDCNCMHNLNVAMRMVCGLQMTVAWNKSRLPELAFSFDAISNVNVGLASSSISDVSLVPTSSSCTTTLCICVKWGTKYGPQYVNNLYHGLMRHLLPDQQKNVVFACLTDDTEGIMPEVVCESLSDCPADWQGWWLKARLFSCAALAKIPRGTPVIYLDLDTVLLRPIDVLWKLPVTRLQTINSEHFRSEGRGIGINSSAIVWPAGYYEYLYTYLEAHYAQVTQLMFKFDHYLEFMLFSERDAALECDFLQDVHPGLIVDYATLGGSEESDAMDCSIVCFPLSPKPHQLPAASWLKTNWCPSAIASGRDDCHGEVGATGLNA